MPPPITTTIIGPVARARACAVEDLRFLKAHTDRRVKMARPGPMTALKRMEDAHHGNQADLAMALADALREEMQDLQAEGCDVIQSSSPIRTNCSDGDSVV